MVGYLWVGYVGCWECCEDERRLGSRAEVGMGGSCCGGRLVDVHKGWRGRGVLILRADGRTRGK